MANEKLQYEIAALYSGQPEIKKAFDDFAKLNAAGAKVTRELDKLATANKAAGGAIRENRHATAQLGMQFNQFGTQIAGGTSPLLAMQQQLGDVGYALSGMNGILGTVGRFLAGPWGVAVMLGAGVVSALWGVMQQGDEVSKEFQQSIDASRDALFDYKVSIASTRTELIKLYETQIAGIEIKWREAATDVGKYGGEVQRTQRTLEKWASTGLIKVGQAYFANKEASEALLEAQKREGDSYRSLLGIQQTFNNLKNKFSKEDDKAAQKREKASKGNIKEVDVLLQRQMEVVAQFNAGKLSYGEYLNKLDEVTDGYKRNGESAKDMIRLQLQALESLERIRESGKFVAGEMDKDLKMPKVDMTALEGYAYFAQGIKDRNEEIKNSFDSIGMSVSDAFKGMLTAGMSWRDGMRGIINAVIDNLWQLFVVKQITGFITSSLGGLFGGGGMPTAGNIMASTNASLLSNPAGLVGQFANGTVNAPGGMALVGERGPEIVNLPRGSQVIPAHRSKNMAGGGVTVNVDARGSADPAAVRAQVQQGIMEAAPALIAAAEQRTMANMRRPRLGGAMQ